MNIDKLFLDRIISCFKKYIQELQNPSNENLRLKFEQFWDGFKGV